MPKHEAIQVTVHGTVQGVGFRATTAMTARKFEIHGTVRNQADGTVFIEAEGRPEELDAFLDAIRASRLGSLLTRMDITRGTATGRFSGGGFRIQYW